MTLIGKLKEKWEGKTQAEIEAESKIPQYVVSRILSGKIGRRTARRITEAYPDLAFDAAAFLLSDNMQTTQDSMQRNINSKAS